MTVTLLQPLSEILSSIIPQTTREMAVFDISSTGLHGGRPKIAGAGAVTILTLYWSGSNSMRLPVSFLSRQIGEPSVLRTVMGSGGVMFCGLCALTPVIVLGLVSSSSSLVTGG